MSKVNSAIAGASAGASVGGPWGAVAGGVGGYLLGKDDESGNYTNQMLQAAQSIPLPILKEYYPELYKQVASLNPEMETGVSMGPSAMAGISTDPAERQAQMGALAKLQSIGNAGGRDAQFMADQSQLESDVNAQEAGHEGAIQQSLAAKGLNGGMSELVQRNLSAQGAANREAQMGMDAKAQAQQRALSALSQSGTLAGQMQAQDFGQASAKAQAADAINKFNTQNTQSVQNANVQAKNQAAAVNMDAAQNAADKSTATSNAAQQYNLGLNQQQYQNQMQKVGMGNSALQTAADNSQRAAASQDQFVGGLATAAATYAASQKEKDKNKPPAGGA